jgi:endoglucanase
MAGWNFDDAARDRLLEMLDTPAPTGFEGPSGDVFLRHASAFAETRRDGVGNCYATVNATPDGGARRPRVMLMGHLDEIGFVVTKTDDEGLIRFQPVGGWDASVAVGQRVRVLAEGGVHVGTIGRLAPHQMEHGEEGEVKLKDLWIDVGMASGDDLRAAIRPGDPIVLDATPVVFANGRVMSRSLDDRIGAYVALEAARACAGLGVEVVAVGSVREETVQLGALAASYELQPDHACVIDVSPAPDVPGDHDEDVELGKGPTITFGASTSTRTSRALLDAATASGRPFQLQAAGGDTYTDADEVVHAGAGVQVAVVSVPCRYLHSPGELLDMADVALTIDLLTEWITALQ